MNCDVYKRSIIIIIPSFGDEYKKVFADTKNCELADQPARMGSEPGVVEENKVLGQIHMPYLGQRAKGHRNGEEVLAETGIRAVAVGFAQQASVQPEVDFIPLGTLHERGADPVPDRQIGNSAAAAVVHRPLRNGFGDVIAVLQIEKVKRITVADDDFILRSFTVSVILLGRRKNPG